MYHNIIMIDFDEPISQPSAMWVVPMVGVRFQKLGLNYSTKMNCNQNLKVFNTVSSFTINGLRYQILYRPTVKRLNNLIDNQLRNY